MAKKATKKRAKPAKRKPVKRSAPQMVSNEPAPMRIPLTLTRIQADALGAELRYKDDGFKKLFAAAGKKGK